MSSEKQVVVVKGGGAGSVFAGLFLFFIVLPVVAVLGCFACTGVVINSAVNEAKKHTPLPIVNPPRATPVVTAEPQEQVKQPEPKIRRSDIVQASELLAQYQNNQIAADQAYKERTLVVQGVAERIGTDLLNIPYVTFKSGKQFDIFSVQCYFADQDKNALASVRPGSTYIVKGRCDGKFGNVMLKECSFVSEDALETESDERSTEAEQPKARVDDRSGIEPDLGAAPPKDVEPAQPRGAQSAASIAESDPLHQVRTWTSANGKHTIEAEFAGYGNGILTLKKKDGSKMKIPIEKLSDADQLFIKNRR